MKVSFRQSFEKDLKAIKDPKLFSQIKKLIFKIESTQSLSEIQNIKKLAGRSDFYRIRIGDYRVGIIFASGEVSFVRVLHRKEIYRYFP